MVPLRYNLRSLAVRKVTTGATAIGLALVVFVFAAAQMLQEGVQSALGTSGRPDIAVILRDGSDSELASRVSMEVLGLLRERPEVARGGGEAVIGEMVSIINGRRADGNGAANVLLRGTPADGVAFRPEVKITRGKLPAPGTNEVMIGAGLVGRFTDLDFGKTYELRRNRPVQVVGVFSAAGNAYESEVWGDLDVLRTSLGRDALVSSARVRLASAAQFASFKASMAADKRLGVKVQRESEFYASQSEATSGFLVGMGTAIAVLFALAAMIGAAITMNGAVAHRTREIGTLRALGFSRLAILASFVFEAIVLALLGAAIGLVCVMGLSFVSFPTLNQATFSEVIIGFQASPGVVISALIFAIIMGLIGGLAPAIRASRVSPVEAMRG